MLAGLEAFLHVFLLGDTKLWQIGVLGKAGTSLPWIECRRWGHTHMHLNNGTENQKSKFSNLHVVRSQGADLLLKPLPHTREGHAASGEQNVSANQATVMKQSLIEE